jgi:hypothetical protein
LPKQPESRRLLNRRSFGFILAFIRVIRGLNVFGCGGAALGNPRFRIGSKNFKKSRKKACQPLASSARPELRTTNSTVWPFKKSTKKVKKKLVRPLEI